MGWSYDDKTEFFTVSDLIEKFDLGKLNPSPAAIDFKKLDHFNGLHIRALALDELAKRLVPYFAKAGYSVDEAKLRPIVPLIQTRMTTLDEGPELAGFFFREDVSVPTEKLLIKDKTAAESAAALAKAISVLEALPEFTAAAAEAPMRAAADELGIKAGALFTQLRNATTGQEISPPLFESMEIMGRETVLARLRAGLQGLEG
jgi:glutamyl-tRNA synthetase